MSNGIFQAFATDDAGNVIPNCAYSVLNDDGDLVSLFSDRDGTIGISNPAIADANGLIQFYTASGFVTVSATSGSISRVWSNVLIAGTAAAVDATSDSAVIDAGVDGNVVVTPLSLYGSKYNTDARKVIILSAGEYTSGSYSYPNSYSEADFQQIEIFGGLTSASRVDASVSITSEIIDYYPSWSVQAEFSITDSDLRFCRVDRVSSTSYSVSASGSNAALFFIVGYLKPEAL